MAAGAGLRRSRAAGRGHAASREAGHLTIGFDVLGGQYAWLPTQPGCPPTVHYFGPDDLGWLDLEQGYTDWLHAVLSGSMTRFYETLRWPGWEHEVSATAPDQGITTYPPPWSVEGKDLATVSRMPMPLTQLVAYFEDTARQLGQS